MLNGMNKSGLKKLLKLPVEERLELAKQLRGSVRQDEDGPGYRFLSIPGLVYVSAGDGLRYEGHQVVTLRPGRNDVTLELAPPCGVRFIYEHGGTRITLPRGVRSPELQALQGEGKGVGWSTPKFPDESQESAKQLQETAREL